MEQTPTKVKTVKFGPGGNSESFYAAGKKSTVEAPGWVSEYGLDAYEYEAGNGITASNASLAAVGRKAAEHSISISLHAPYFISLSSTDPEKRLKSVEYIKKSASAADILGAGVFVVHTGSAAKLDRREAMGFAAETLKLTDEMLAENGYKAKVGLETMGKMNQLGTLDEVLELCALSERFVPVVDFGHINARGQGCLKTKRDYLAVFEAISDGMGRKYAENLHCHFSKIEYTAMGEKKHLTFADKIYGPEFLPLAEAIYEFGAYPTVICESAGTMAEDALEMKSIFYKTGR